MRRAAVVNYSTLAGIGVVFVAASLALPALISPHVEGAGDLGPTAWVETVVRWYIGSSLLCVALSLLWLYMSEHIHRIDWTGRNSQRSYWLLYLFAVLLCPFIGFLLWDHVEKGAAFAFSVVLLAALAQFWLGTLVCSPNPLSIVGGEWFRRRGIL